MYLDIFENRVCFTVLAFFWHINSIFGHKNAGSWKIFLVKNNRTTDSQSIIFVKDNRWNPSTTISYACPKLWNKTMTCRSYSYSKSPWQPCTIHLLGYSPVCMDAVCPGGTPMWKGQGCSLEILNYTSKGDQFGRGPTVFDPYKCFDYMNRVNQINWKYIIFYISLCATLKEIPFWPNIIINGVLPRTP